MVNKWAVFHKYPVWLKSYTQVIPKVIHRKGQVIHRGMCLITGFSFWESRRAAAQGAADARRGDGSEWDMFHVERRRAAVRVPKREKISEWGTKGS